VFQSEQPSYRHGLFNVQSFRTTRSSVIITLQRPFVCSRLKITDRSFTHHASVLWNNSLPKQLRQPSGPSSHGTSTDSSTLLALSSHHFHSKLTIVTLFFSIYLLHFFNLSLTLLLVLSLKLLNFITLLLFLNLSTGSR